MNDTLQAFNARLQEAKLVVQGGIQADGKLHRCGTSDKPKGTDGAYVAFVDNNPTIWCCNWKTDYSGTWTAKEERSMTPAEWKAYKQRIETAQAAFLEEQKRRHADGARRAEKLLKALPSASAEHPYLKAKQVPCLGDMKHTKDGQLVLPVLDESDNVQSIQFITEDGEKRFLKDAKTKGGFFSIPAKDGNKTGPLVIAEGYATAASIHQATGHAVLVAFNAGNLLSVAKIARGKYPEREIVIAADYDAPNGEYSAPGGIGVAKAEEAARAVDAYLAVPRREGCNKLDWNDLAIKMGAGEVRTQFQTRQKPAPLSMPGNDTQSKEQLPKGFSLRLTGPQPGLWHTEIKEGAEPVERWLGAPLHVLGKTRDENSNSWGLLLAWNDADGVAHTWAMPKESLVSQDPAAWLGQLVSGGWDCAPGRKERHLVALYLSACNTEKRVRCVARTGWHDGAYVLPDKVFYPCFSSGRTGRTGQAYGENDFSRPESKNSELDELDELDGERIVLQIQARHNPFQTAGTLEGWRNTVAAWTRGNTRLMLALCAAFAAPLLELCGMESGGFNFTGQSSTGKTTALVAAASVWGKGTSSGGYVQNWRATSNGLEGMAVLFSDALLCLDEIGQAPGRTIQEAAYMLANGTGKGRARQDGSLKAASSWRLLLLSTGEIGLAEKIKEEGGRVKAGQAVRLIDIPADAGAGWGIFENIHDSTSPQAFADALKRAAAANYGHAAWAFITIFQEQNRKEVKKELIDFLDRWLVEFCPSDADGQVKRVALRLLLCAAAGETAAEWGILPWNKGEALQAMRTCFNAWLNERGGTGAAEDTAIIEQIMLFLEQHGQSRFQDVNNPDAICPTRAGFRQTVDNDTLYYIMPKNFKAEVCKGHDAKRAAALLLDKELLLPGDSGSCTRRPSVDLPGWGRRRCYTIVIRGDTGNVD